MLNKKILLISLSAFSLLATGSLFVPGANAELRTVYQYVYYDKNGDGYIDHDEYDIQTHQVESHQPMPPALAQTQLRTQTPIQARPDVIVPRRSPQQSRAGEWTYYTARTTLNTDTGVDYRTFDVWDIERDRILQGIPEQAGATRQTEAGRYSITAETEWQRQHGLR